MIFRNLVGAALMATGLGGTAQAQFMSAEEVKPILAMTQSSWVGVRVWEGQDLLYFTQLLSFRCGLDAILYGINGEAATNLYEMEPCHVGTPSPFSFDIDLFPVYVTFPVGSVHSVTIRLKYDDGTKEEVTFQRADIQLP